MPGLKTLGEDDLSKSQKKQASLVGLFCLLCQELPQCPSLRDGAMESTVEERTLVVSR